MEKKNYRVKRLCEKDIPEIKLKYKEYENLNFTPFTDDFIWRVLIGGSFWGVFSGDDLLAVTYTAPFNCNCFDNMLSKWELSDLENGECENSLICGYIGGERNNRNVNRAIYWLWLLEALRSEKERLIFYTPAHFYTDFDSLFSSGFCLRGLRGLDKLVPHYIFVKRAEMTSFSQGIVAEQSVSITDTKQISKLCESGYVGYGMENDKLLFTMGGHIFD